MSGTAMEYAAYIPGGALLLPALTAGRLRRPRSAPAEAADKRAVPCDAPTVPGYLGKRTHIRSLPGPGRGNGAPGVPPPASMKRPRSGNGGR